jgi:hypothetical protein
MNDHGVWRRPCWPGGLRQGVGHVQSSVNHSISRIERKAYKCSTGFADDSLDVKNSIIATLLIATPAPGQQTHNHEPRGTLRVPVRSCSRNLR